MDYSKKIEASLFETALGLEDPQEQAAFLDRTCHGDPALRKRLESLLDLRGKAENFFNLPPVKIPVEVTRLAILQGEDGDSNQQAAALLGSGACVGHFKLLNRIGEGGCGVVYLAEQLEPVHREVALKIIRLGMDTEAVIARFEMERKALAMMEHPNIARVLDAGSTSSGRPFFVMELVRGTKITDFCNHSQLTLNKRLELFIQVCNAIQHAHQKGVIHRDLKPSNVLVQELDGVPVPKVIDFGIAKATAGGQEQQTAITDSGQWLGTPAYMSPEQAAGGEDVDTRSDIYSLGVLLYELVSGQPPFDPQQLKELGPHEARRVICEQDPPPPSSHLRKHTLVELDWIVMKAMAKERHFRYHTASGFAADVRRFLNNEPVSAGPMRRGYRFGKLIRRNRTTFFAGTVAVLALLAGLGVSTLLYFLEKDARLKQGRLRHLAEVARNNESQLRQSAEYQALVSKATVLIRYGNIEGADELLAAVPIMETPSSLEAGETYRRVADWHLTAGRWQEAAQRYASLVRAIANADSSDNDAVSRNLLTASAAIGFTGDWAAYEQIRDFAVNRFSATTHPVVAEQVLKVSLLLPADERLLARLRPLALVVSNELEKKDGPLANNEHLAAWACFSLALMNFRDGNDDAAAQWAHRSMAYKPENPARNCSAKIVLAMIGQRAGKTAEARELIDLASGPVVRNSDVLPRHGDDLQGSWHAWVTARILLREAMPSQSRHGAMPE